VTGRRPRVDVGVVVWNTRELTLSAIERLQTAAQDVDVRVLVRDNGSTDGSADAIRAAFPDVSVTQGDNVGFARGVNSLLAVSDAPWFVTLNSDAWPEAGALGQLVAAAEDEPRAAVVAPLLLRPDGQLEHSTHPLPSVRVAAVTALHLERALPRRRAAQWCLHGRWQHDVQRTVGWAVGAALLFRREAIDAIGGFDESLFMYAEDLEWCWRARRAGWEILFTPAAVVRHVGNASGTHRWGAEREIVAITNANAVVRRFLPAPAAATWRTLNAIGAARLAARARIRGDRELSRFWWRQVPAHLARRTAG
jgi:GT2 family glycosyltransferase